MEKIEQDRKIYRTRWKVKNPQNVIWTSFMSSNITKTNGKSTFIVHLFCRINAKDYENVTIVQY